MPEIAMTMLQTFRSGVRVSVCMACDLMMIMIRESQKMHRSVILTGAPQADVVSIDWEACTFTNRVAQVRFQPTADTRPECRIVGGCM